MLDDFDNCWENENITDKVRLSAQKVIDILGDSVKLDLAGVDGGMEIYLGMSTIEPLDYEVERVILASFNGSKWHVICSSGRDTTSEEDRLFSNLGLLMMVDGVTV